MTNLLLNKSNTMLNGSDACAAFIFALDLRIIKIQERLIQRLNYFNEFDEGAT